jgi:uncharacterized damage-inducible protein DinB
MSSLSSDQAAFARELALRSLNAEHAVTRRVIEAIPADKSDYRPEPFVKTAQELAWHIVTAEHRFLDSVVNGAFDLSPSQRPAEVVTPADISRWYADTFAKDVARVEAASPDALGAVIDFRGIFRMPAVLFLQIGLNHSIHHRGQLSMYLRPMGAKVPAIYGESYDSAQAKQAR